MQRLGWVRQRLAAGIFAMSAVLAAAQPPSLLHPGPLKPGEGLTICFSEWKALFSREGWWILPATGPVPGQPGATSAWVVAGREGALVVLHLPRGRGDHEGLARFHEILGKT